MSDDEEVHSEGEEEATEEVAEDAAEQAPAPRDSGPSEAQQAMQRRRAATKIDTSALDEEGKELLAENAELRAKMEEEIEELRQRSERRKKEREAEEKQAEKRRRDEEERRRKDEEERSAKKNAEDTAKNTARAEKLAEFEKWKNVSKPNFVISKKDTSGEAEEADEDEDDETKEKKSKEQLESEKRAILAQRTVKLEISGFDAGKLTAKATELHNLIVRLESEKYDLEKRFKAQQYDMMELAERARSMNKVGKGAETLKRVQMTDEVDKFAEIFAGCPSKIEMYSVYERQKDKRTYVAKQDLYTGPQYLFAAEKIKPERILKWSEEGLPLYEELSPEEAQAEAEN